MYLLFVLMYNCWTYLQGSFNIAVSQHGVHGKMRLALFRFSHTRERLDTALC